jgi:hypothetical protein
VTRDEVEWRKDRRFMEEERLMRVERGKSVARRFVF